MEGDSKIRDTASSHNVVTSPVTMDPKQFGCGLATDAASIVILAGSDGRVASPWPAGDRVVDDTGPDEEVDVAERLGQTITDNENYDHQRGQESRQHATEHRQQQQKPSQFHMTPAANMAKCAAARPANTNGSKPEQPRVVARATDRTRPP